MLLRLCLMVRKLAALAAIIFGFISFANASPGEYTINRDGSINIAGRALSCGRARNYVDYRVPSPGMASLSGEYIKVNPRYLRRMPPLVRVFVYYHECGHLVVGSNEVRADCWGLRRGIREGWVNEKVLKQIGQSFGNRPRTTTHPSGPERRRYLRQCYGRYR
jgi:hypothetical protein